MDALLENKTTIFYAAVILGVFLGFMLRPSHRLYIVMSAISVCGLLPQMMRGAIPLSFQSKAEDLALHSTIPLCIAFVIPQFLSSISQILFRTK
jgi:hypothetical protein